MIKFQTRKPHCNPGITTKISTTTITINSSITIATSPHSPPSAVRSESLDISDLVYEAIKDDKICNRCIRTWDIHEGNETPAGQTRMLAGETAGEMGD